ncbi:MAG: POTRA domain-containing protein [Bacteroidota bacterium]
MQRWLRIGWILLLLSGAGSLMAQILRLQILSPDPQLQTFQDENFWPDTTYQDSISLKGALGTCVQTLHSLGHLEASVDTLLRVQGGYTAIMHLGPQFTWINLQSDQIPRLWLNKVGFRERLFAGKPLQVAEWLELQEGLAQQAANSGFPFARVYLDEIEWNPNGEVSASIGLQRNTLIFFEDVEIEGEVQISKQYLLRHLGLTSGQVYNESLIQQVKQRLQELAFLQLKKDPQVQFIGDQARLLLELAPKRASRFDFILGVLPRSQQTGRLLITAQLDGALQNALGKGERIALAFEQLRPQTQELDLAFQYPYLLQLPFGVDAQLNLYRRDTNFINLNWRLGVDYILSRGRSIQVFWAQNQTNLLSIDSNQIRSLGRLPDTLDLSRNTFGLGFQLSRVDYQNNPRQGWQWQLRFGAGQKTIRRNNEIEAIGESRLYDSLRLRSAQYQLETNLAWYVPLGQRGVIKTGLRGAALIADEPVLANEQLRIGGNRLLRGFDEEGIFATNYGLGTLEYRFLLSTDSYLYAFYDLARVDNESLSTIDNTGTVLWYQGVGAGITFETRAGLFGLSLAFGKQEGLAFDFGAPKVHFGYVSLF